MPKRPSSNETAIIFDLVMTEFGETVIIKMIECIIDCGNGHHLNDWLLILMTENEEMVILLRKWLSFLRNRQEWRYGYHR
jgi:hypothetical protein